MGKVWLDEQITPNQRLSVLPNFFDIHIKRWLAAGRTSMFIEDSAREFYRLLLQDSELHALIDFTSLNVDGKNIAHHIGFWGGGRLLVYKWCFDPSLQKAGPGTVLMVHLMAHAAKRGILEFDFMRGGENYKERFANASHLSHDWRAFASPARRRFHEAKAYIRQNHPLLATSLGALSRGDFRSAWRTLKTPPVRAVSNLDT
jgi:CelD/BcsL family acetyltransferase involved in cellulose biosynthesis